MKKYLVIGDPINHSQSPQLHNFWIKKNNIQNVCIPYVAKGNWRAITKKLIKKNPSINFVYLHREYDKEAWKYSKKGFFNFKKHIPELITKINDERNFKN